MINPNPDITQKDKKEILENDRKVRATYFSHASADMLDDRGGRFATLNKPTVTGSSPSGWAPRQPVNSPWARDHCPPEPVLGYSVETVEPVGEIWEQQKSLSSAAHVAATAPTLQATPTCDVGASKFRRRV